MEEIKYVAVENNNKYQELRPNKDDVKKPDTLYFTTVTGALPILAGCTGFAWPSPVLPKLLSNDTNINPLDKPVTTIEISLIVGLPCLIGLVGSLLSAPVSDVIGRKKCMQIMALGLLLCNFMIAFSTQAIYIIISRSLFFIFYSGAMTVTPVFITEICEDHNRAKFGCLLGLLPPSGTLYAFVFGPPFSVRIFTLITAIPLILFLMLFYFVPETPVFSLSKGRNEECRKALNQLRNNKNKEEIELDFNKINATLNIKHKIQQVGIISLFKTREGRIGMLFVCIPIMMQFLSGAPILMPFLGSIFNKGATSISGNNIAIITGVVKCLIFGITSFVVERTGKKPLLLYSSIGCGIPLIILGWFFFLNHISSPLVNQLNWLPLASFTVYIISFSLGIGPVPQSLIGEMFTIDLRAAASSFIITTLGLSLSLLTSGLPILAEFAGLHWCFWIFAFNCFVGCALIYIILPETRGKSLNEIQELLKNYKFVMNKKT